MALLKIEPAMVEAKHLSKGQSSDGLLSRAPPCFVRHVKLLVQVRSGRRPVVQIIAESLSRRDEKHVVPTPLSETKVGK
jgi:hypothetical protein